MVEGDSVTKLVGYDRSDFPPIWLADKVGVVQAHLGVVVVRARWGSEGRHRERSIAVKEACHPAPGLVVVLCIKVSHGAAAVGEGACVPNGRRGRVPTRDRLNNV